MKLFMCLFGAVFAATALVGPAHAAKPEQGQITVVQAVPGTTVDVAIDGKTVQRQVKVGSLVGPISLAPGTHELVFSGAPGGRPIKTSLNLKAGSSSDVVMHRPAAVNGAPVVSTYRTPTSPIGPGKARIFLAHTATVSPADVRFDGQIVFTNIANGEFADAAVPAGPHQVALLATGTTKDPILGPLDVDLAPRTATMVYAIGNPRSGSMDAIVHVVDLPSNGAKVPRSINTGSAGLAAGVAVTPFDSLPEAADAQRSATAAQPIGTDGPWWIALGVGILLLGSLAIRVAGFRPMSGPGRRKQSTSLPG